MSGEDEDQYETDENEFQTENGMKSHIIEDEDDDEDIEMDVSEKFTSIKKRHVPDQMAVFLWSQARYSYSSSRGLSNKFTFSKTGADYVEDEWKAVNQTSLIKSYTVHPEAVMFSAQMADAECPDLKFKEKINLRETGILACNKLSFLNKCFR